MQIKITQETIQPCRTCGRPDPAASEAEAARHQDALASAKSHSKMILSRLDELEAEAERRHDAVTAATSHSKMVLNRLDELFPDGSRCRHHEPTLCEQTETAQRHEAVSSAMSNSKMIMNRLNELYYDAEYHRYASEELNDTIFSLTRQVQDALYKQHGGPPKHLFKNWLLSRDRPAFDHCLDFIPGTPQFGDLVARWSDPDLLWDEFYALSDDEQRSPEPLMDEDRAWEVVDWLEDWLYWTKETEEESGQTLWSEPGEEQGGAWESEWGADYEEQGGTATVGDGWGSEGETDYEWKDTAGDDGGWGPEGAATDYEWEDPAGEERGWGPEGAATDYEWEDPADDDGGWGPEAPVDDEEYEDIAAEDEYEEAFSSVDYEEEQHDVWTEEEVREPVWSVDYDEEQEVMVAAAEKEGQMPPSTVDYYEEQANIATDDEAPSTERYEGQEATAPIQVVW